MSGRIVDFEGHAHRDAERLLPWLVNGTLESEESAWLQRHIDECALCQRELVELRALQSAYAQDAQAASSDPEQAWKRLRERLRNSGNTEALRSRRRWWRSAADDWRQTTPWLRYALTAQAAALALGLALWAPRERPAEYRTLGASTAARGALVIVFDPRTTEAQVARLLRASEARIVDGPNDAGAYVLAVPSERLATVRDALRAAPGVTLVESLSPQGKQ
ncbi:MAG: zf-HC2 domain-containing protein [Luteimonas sp.]